MPEVPEGGLCLSAFLIITNTENVNSAVMGHLNPNAPWDHLGALDKTRKDLHSTGWMLPSSHLIVYESPNEAAARILREQLNLQNVKLNGPQVVSETYVPKRFPNLAKHWDIEFIYKAHIQAKELPKSSAWTELKIIDLAVTKRSEIARSHEDVLESAGLRFGSAKT